MYGLVVEKTRRRESNPYEPPTPVLKTTSAASRNPGVGTTVKYDRLEGVKYGSYSVRKLATKNKNIQETIPCLTAYLIKSEFVLISRSSMI